MPSCHSKTEIFVEQILGSGTLLESQPRGFRYSKEAVSRLQGAPRARVASPSLVSSGPSLPVRVTRLHK